MRLLWAHPLPPPPELRPAPCPLHGQPVGADEGVVWGPRASWGALASAAPGARLLSTSSDDVARARALGLAGVLIPDLTAATLTRASGPGILCVPRGTLWAADGVLWVEGGVERLPPALRPLAAALARGPVPTDPSRRMAISRLRARLGGAIVTERGRGWRLVPLSPSLPSAPEGDISWRALAAGRYAPAQHVAEVADERHALTRAEVAALDLLWRAEGRPVSGDALTRAAGAPAASLVHRLRQKLGRDAIGTVRGAGYRLPLPATSDSPPDLVRLEQLSARHALVFVCGLVGAGKTHLLGRLAGRRGQQVVDLDGLADDRQARRLGSLRSQAPRALIVDGLRDASACASELDALRRAGFRLVVGARLAPRDAPRLDLALPEDERLASEPPERRLARLAHVPELERLAAFPGGFGEDDVPRSTLRRWQRAGILSGGGPWRLPTPLCDAVWSTWGTERQLAWAEASLARFDRVVHQRPHQRETLIGAVKDTLRAVPLLHAAGRSAAPTIALLGHIAAREIRSELLDHELDRPELPGNDRARLLFARFMQARVSDPRHLEEAVACASGETRADMLVQLAYYRYATDPALAGRLLDEATAWLDTRPADEAAWVRSEALLVGFQVLDRHELLGELIAHAGRLEQLRLDGQAGDAMFEGMRRRTLHCVGQGLLAADRPAEAVAALELSIAAGVGALSWGAVELVAAWGRLGRWADARRVIDACAHELPRVPSWASLMRVVRGLNALWQGDRTTARRLWSASPDAGASVERARDQLGALLDVAEGTSDAMPPVIERDPWMSPRQRAVFLEDVRLGTWADGDADDPLPRTGWSHLEPMPITYR